MHYEYKNNKLVTDDPNPPEWWKRVVHFVEVEIPAVKWMSGCGEVLPEWKVFETRDAASDALDAAWNAARDAASDASDAWDASLMAAMHLTSDLDVANEHRAHTAKRWDVWGRGYGVRCGGYRVFSFYQPL